MESAVFSDIEEKAASQSLDAHAMENEGLPPAADENGAPHHDDDNDDSSSAASRDEFEVYWDEPEDQDSANPMNWSSTRRLWTIAMVSALSFLTSVQSFKFK